MKKILCIFLLLKLSFASAQQISEVMAEYDIIFSFNGPNKYDGKLIFNSNFSMFTYKLAAFNNQYTELDKSDNSAEVIMLDTSKFQISINKKNNQLLDKKKSIYSKKIFLVEETIPVINWVLEKGTKKFNQFLCKKATCNFRGRKYIVWYCPELPYSYGPWKLNGLPGLIVEAKDIESQIIFTLKKIITPFSEKIQSFETAKYTLIKYQDYRELTKKEIEEFQKRLISKMDRSLNVSVSMKQDDIERD